MLSPDIMNIHNNFSFILKHMVAHSAFLNGIKTTSKEKRLGNSRSVTYWRLQNSISIVNSMHDIDKYLRKD